jgi:uncharacterized protein
VDGPGEPEEAGAPGVGLNFVQGRVLGSLIEKQLSTPNQYPLTLNALVLACNQSSNRTPVVELTEPEVAEGAADLKAARLARAVLPSHGRTVVRHRHVLDEEWGLDPRQLALLATLLLRGPQTAAELRTRTERLAEFDGLGDVEHTLGLMAERTDPLVVRLGRRPGQKEERWAQLVAADGDVSAPTDPTAVVRPMAIDVETELAELRRAVGELSAELAELRATLADLVHQLGD